jgi:hypothetical protein
MFMVSCFGLSRAGVQRCAGGPGDIRTLPYAAGFLLPWRLRQTAGTCNAEIGPQQTLRASQSLLDCAYESAEQPELSYG